MIAATALVLLLLLALVVWPLLCVLWASLSGPAGFTLARYGELFGHLQTSLVVLRSLLVAAVSTALTLLLGLFVAYGVTRTTMPGRRVVALLGLLPFVSPPFMVALAFILLFGNEGLLGRGPGTLEGLPALVVAQVLTFVPRAFVRLSRILTDIDPALEEAAENLGAPPLRTLRRITLALAAPRLASTALAIFILGMTDFANPILLGGPYRVLTTEIYTQVGMQNVGAAATLGVVLLAVCLAAYLVDACWIVAKTRAIDPSDSPPASRVTPATLRWSLFALSAGLLAILAMIYGLVPLASVVVRWGSDWSFSLAHYALPAAEVGRPLRNTAAMALAVGVAGTAVALLAAYIATHPRRSAGRLVASLSFLPTALPGIVVGLGFLVMFSAPRLPLAGPLALLIASVVVLYLPMAVRIGVDALTAIDPAVEEAAVNLGADRLRVLSRIVRPLVSRAAVGMFLSFCMSGMLTVSAVVFLVRPGFELGSVTVLQLSRSGRLGPACAVTTFLLAGVLFMALGLRWSGLRQERGL